MEFSWFEVLLLLCLQFDFRPSHLPSYSARSQCIIKVNLSGSRSEQERT